jgi:hypothetical protein
MAETGGVGEGAMFKSAVVGISAAIVGVLLGTTWSQAQQVPMAGVQMQHAQMMG